MSQDDETVKRLEAAEARLRRIEGLLGPYAERKDEGSCSHAGREGQEEGVLVREDEQLGWDANEDEDVPRLEAPVPVPRDPVVEADDVQALDYVSAGRTSLVLVIFSLLALSLTAIAGRREWRM